VVLQLNYMELGHLNIKPLKDRRRLLRKDETESESILWGYLRNRKLGFRFVRQFSVDNYVLDFYCPQKKLGIEIEGGIHQRRENRVYDKYRESYLGAFGVKVIKFKNKEVVTQIDEVLKVIRFELTPACRQAGLDPLS
jgi:very-short-patch-repair endonuclease